MITIDGSYGEGGGQILRTALALSALTQQPFQHTNIRAHREQPGLKAQHLAAVTAVQQLCEGTVEGALLGSTKLVFYPHVIHARTIEIDIGTAGSTTLVLQALLLPALFAQKQIKLIVHGGTDVQHAPPANYFHEVLLPHLKKYAHKIDFKLIKRGYYPAGGGTIELVIKPRFTLTKRTLHDLRTTLAQAQPIKLTNQGHLLMLRGTSHASSDLQEARVAERQAHAAQLYLSKKFTCPIKITSEYATTLSTGSGITLSAHFSQRPDDIDEQNPLILGADASGAKGIPAEKIGQTAAASITELIHSKTPLDDHLADMLIPFMALHPGSIITPIMITNHTRTNIYVTEQFLGHCIKIDEKNKRIESCQEPPGS